MAPPHSWLANITGPPGLDWTMTASFQLSIQEWGENVKQSLMQTCSNTLPGKSDPLRLSLALSTSPEITKSNYST